MKTDKERAEALLATICHAPWSKHVAAVEATFAEIRKEYESTKIGKVPLPAAPEGEL